MTDRGLEGGVTSATDIEKAPLELPKLLVDRRVEGRARCSPHELSLRSARHASVRYGFFVGAGAGVTVACGGCWDGPPDGVGELDGFGAKPQITQLNRP